MDSEATTAASISSLHRRQARWRQRGHEPHMVYEFYDDHGEAVYVGCTADMAARLASHQRGPFWHEVAEIHTTRYPNRRAALAEEEGLIRDLQPRWNLTYTEQASDNARERHRKRRAQNSA